MRIFSLLLLLLINIAHAQVIAPPDTFMCLSQPITLTATYLGGGGTTSYADSLIPVNITPITGQVYSGPDDQNSPVVNMNFDFCFYGNSYNQCIVSTNNYIQFNTAAAGGYSPWVTQAIPNPAAPTNAVMGPWMDINPGVGGTLRYATVGTAPNRVFIASYENIPMFSCTSLLYNGQIKLYENGGIIETHITNLPLCASWNSGNSVHGLHNATGTVAHVVPGRNNTQTTLVNEGRRFYPNAVSNIYWYDINMNLLGTGASITVTPTQTTQYIVTLECKAMPDTVTVFIGSVGLNIEKIDESCWNNNDGVAFVELPNNSPWDVTWLNIFNNPVQQTVGAIGSDTVYGLSAGAYFVELYDVANQCTVKDTVYIDQPPPILVQSDVIPNWCGQSTGSISLQVSEGYGPLTWMWDDGSTELSRNNLQNGDYTIVITDSIGCDTTYTFTIADIYPVSASIDGNPLTGQVPLNVDFLNFTTGATEYSWDFGDGGNSTDFEPSYTFIADGSYAVVLTATDTVSGCVEFDTLRILVESLPRLQMPNVFTPNGNFPYFNTITTNDSTANIVDFIGIIYNRWGKKVYEWTDWQNTSAGWDGTIGGQAAAEGTYYYTVRALGKDQSVIEQSGFLMLIRN